MLCVVSSTTSHFSVVRHSSTHQRTHPSIHPSIHPSVRPPVHPSRYASQSHELVLDYEAGKPAGASWQDTFANLTAGWEDLTSEVAATVLFAGMYALVLGLVGLCAVITGRQNLIVL